MHTPNAGVPPADSFDDADTSCSKKPLDIENAYLVERPCSDRRGNAPPQALVIEDIREASAILKEHGYQCIRITYGELMSCPGEEYLRKLLSGQYQMLWISTPVDWYVKPRERRTQPLYERIANWMTRAANLDMQLVVYGPPGAVWKQQTIKDTIEKLELNVTRMRLCFSRRNSTDPMTYPAAVIYRWLQTWDFQERFGHAVASCP